MGLTGYESARQQLQESCDGIVCTLVLSLLGADRE